MAEFIGSRISLISKSDIRYVGTLHEINSENSTVALENVTSFGTEGRKGNPDEEIASSENVYEYIIFRGSDVKDLRIEEPPKENQPPQPPQVPNDPAILGSGARPQSQNAPPQQLPGGPRQQPPFQHQQAPFPYQHNQQFQQQRFPGPQGQPGFPPPPNGYGFPPQGPQGGQFYGGGPPGFYPLPGQNFPQPPGPFSPQSFQGQQYPPHMQQQPPQQGGPHRSTPPNQQTPPAGPDGKAAMPQLPTEQSMPTGPKADKEKSQTSTPNPDPANAPPPPLDSKPDVASALAAATTATQPTTTATAGGKPNRVIPAIPLTKVTSSKAAATTANANQPATTKAGDAAANAALQYQNATQAATAAVAAAMAKLPQAGGTKPKAADGAAIDNLTQKVNEMRTDDRNRNHPRGAYTSRGRGRGRGGHARGIDVPNTDFDFESANAKFNKDELAKENTGAASPLASPTNGEGPASSEGGKGDDTADVVIPPPQAYNKSSFFDNISSDAKDREESSGANRGAEFRGEERKRNMETFGLGSVDGYRGGYRGRGRGRGGFRGRGGYGGDRGFSSGRGGGYRGRGGATTAET